MKALANKRWSPDGELDTPYRRARQEWDRRMGGALVQAKNWRLATLLSLGLVGMALVGVVYLGAQPKAVPHIVQIDKIGAPAYLGPIGQPAEYRPSDAAIKYHLRRFIDETRSISTDPAVVKRNWIDAYTLITPNAANQLSAQAEKNDPVKRAERERVTVDVRALVQLSKDSWQADWEEKTWDKAGLELGTKIWRGTFKVLLRPPETEDQLATNPLGLFIDEFHSSLVN
jgi:type IV secretion system protein VirB5